MKKYLVSSVFMMLLLPFSAWAVRVGSLYEAVIPVTSTDSALRDQAVPQGFLQVLTKVSGNTELAKNASIQSALKSSAAYLQQYSYSRDLSSVASDGAPSYELHLRFLPGAVNRVLKSAHLQLWGENRPLVLAWLAINPGDNFSLLTSNSGTSPLPALLQAQGKQRGIPLILPVGDLQDVSNVTTLDVTSLHMDVLQKASTRYNADAIVAGSLVFQTNQWVLNVTLVNKNGEKQTFQFQNPNVDAVVANLMDNITQTLAKTYAVSANAKTQSVVQVQVDNIKSLESYAKVLAYFKQLTPVASVDVVQASSDNLILSLQIVDDPSILKRAIALDSRLAPVTTAENTSVANPSVLIYQWVG